MFASLELSVYRIEDRQKLFSLRLPLPGSFGTTIFPLSSSRALMLGTVKTDLLFLDLTALTLNAFRVPFANIKILKIQQILTKENNFVFLNDYNQILFCKFIQEKPSLFPENDNQINSTNGKHFRTNITFRKLFIRDSPGKEDGRRLGAQV